MKVFFDLFVHNYLTNNLLGKNITSIQGIRENSECKEAIFIPQFCFIQTFRLKQKQKMLKIQPLTTHLFHLEKIILKGKYEVHSLIWQIIAITLRTKTRRTTNKERLKSLQEKNIFAVPKFFTGKDFPLVFKATFIFCPCPLRLERAKLKVFLCVYADVAENPRGQSAIFAHSGFPSCLSFEQGVSVQLAKRALLVVLASKSQRCQTELFHL